MRSNQTLHVMLWLKKAKATKDGKAPIYARITIDGESDEISLSRKAHPKHWDTEIKRVTDPSQDARATNLKIAQIEADLDAHFKVLQKDYEKITPAMLKNAYLGLPLMYTGEAKNSSEIKIPTLIDAFDAFIKQFTKLVEKKQRSKETLKHWHSAKNKIVEFLPFQYKCTDIDLLEVKYSFAENFYNYFTLELEEPISELTAKGYIKKIKQILKECVKKELIPTNPIADFTCGGGVKEIEPLEFTQVQAILQKEIELERLDQVRDAYIFQCFTGFAFQDIYALSPENIVLVGKNAERWLIKDRGKTGVSEMVPILPIVEEIINKYKDDPYCKKNNLLLPINSNSKYNGYLKEIATICDIKRDLNTHLARHTFADMMLNNGVPLEDVSRMLGHKSIRTTQRYCKVRKIRISQSMNMIRYKMFTKDGKLKMVS